MCRAERLLSGHYVLYYTLFVHEEEEYPPLSLAIQVSGVDELIT